MSWGTGLFIGLEFVLESLVGSDTLGSRSGCVIEHLRGLRVDGVSVTRLEVELGPVALALVSLCRIALLRVQAKNFLARGEGLDLRLASLDAISKYAE